jgi:hypothetical protein
MRQLVIKAIDEGVETRLLLQRVRGGGPDRLLLERQMHPLVPAILLGVSRPDALDLNAKP